jgi:hypothetical protein
MNIWSVEVYSNRGDNTPARFGYVSAPDELTAIEYVQNAMGDDLRADMSFQATNVPGTPEGAVLWWHP